MFEYSLDKDIRDKLGNTFWKDKLEHDKKEIKVQFSLPIQETNYNNYLFWYYLNLEEVKRNKKLDISHKAAHSPLYIDECLIDLKKDIDNIIELEKLKEKVRDKLYDERGNWSKFCEKNELLGTTLGKGKNDIFHNHNGIEINGEIYASTADFIRGPEFNNILNNLDYRGDRSDKILVNVYNQIYLLNNKYDDIDWT
jgi:hypothetical protein